MTPPQDVGLVLLVRVHKTPLARSRPLAPSAGDAWFCRWLQLTPPHGAAPLRFPCYQWLEGEGSLLPREETGEGHTGAGVLVCWEKGQGRIGEMNRSRQGGGTGHGVEQGAGGEEVEGRGRWQSSVGEAILLRARDLARGRSSGGGSS